MIIIEGADLVGKTSLARRLLDNPRIQAWGMRYQHLGRPPRGFDHYWDYVDMMSPSVIQDRFHVGELVYPAVRGDASNLSPETLRLVEARLRLVGAYTIILSADTSLLSSRYAERGDASYSLTQIKDANHAFKQIACGYATLGTVQCDRYIALSVTNPCPEDSDVEAIIADYWQRHSAVGEILLRAPRRL